MDMNSAATSSTSAAQLNIDVSTFRPREEIRDHLKVKIHTVHDFEIGTDFLAIRFSVKGFLRGGHFCRVNLINVTIKKYILVDQKTLDFLAVLNFF